MTEIPGQSQMVVLEVFDHIAVWLVFLELRNRVKSRTLY